MIHSNRASSATNGLPKSFHLEKQKLCSLAFSQGQPSTELFDQLSTTFLYTTFL